MRVVTMYAYVYSCSVLFEALCLIVSCWVLWALVLLLVVVSCLLLPLLVLVVVSPPTRWCEFSYEIILGCFVSAPVQAVTEILGEYCSPGHRQKAELEYEYVCNIVYIYIYICVSETDQPAQGVSLVCLLQTVSPFLDLTCLDQWFMCVVGGSRGRHCSNSSIILFVGGKQLFWSGI